MGKNQARYRRGAGVALGAGLVPWAVRSDVARLVVLERPVLFDRYSVPWFLALVGITLGCGLLAWALWLRSTHTRKEVLFRIVALLLAVGLGLLALEVVGRALRPAHYVREEAGVRTSWPEDLRREALVRRPPNVRHVLEVADRPVYRRTWPRGVPGYPTRTVTFTTDTEGYRNLQAPSGAVDVVAIGDSFTEGILVGDEETWPSRLGRDLGREVYNLGVAGADPLGYLGVLTTRGLSLRPKVVVVMVYQENDFWGVPPGPPPFSLGRWTKATVESSPVFLALKGAAIRCFGGIGAGTSVGGLEDLAAWMPAQVPGRPSDPWYVLRSDRVVRHTMSAAEFRASPGWTTTEPVLLRLAGACREGGARLLWVWAPTKEQVVLPLLEERTSADVLHRFASYSHGALPGPQAWREHAFANVDGQESVFRDLCARANVPLVSLTRPLRDAVASGVPAYFTWDQHWTAEGQAVAAAAIREAVGLLLD